jgi:hypothetical protein
VGAVASMWARGGCMYAGRVAVSTCAADCFNCVNARPHLYLLLLLLLLLQGAALCTPPFCLMVSPCPPCHLTCQHCCSPC